MGMDIEQIILAYYGKNISSFPAIFKRLLYAILKKILYLDQINKFLDEHDHLGEKQLIQEFFDQINFSFLISNTDLQKIPSEGRLICIANHPIGSLDGLSLIKAVLEIRSDVKIIANEILYSFENLRPFLLPFKLDSKHSQRDYIKEICKTLAEEGVLIIFPAAEVSRLKGIRVMDSKWHKGAVHFAKKYNAPILPFYVNAKNSFLFYAVSCLSKRLSMLLLAYELFNKKNKTIHIKIGDLIPAKVFTSSFIDDSYQTKLLKKHVYLIGKNHKGIYVTEKNVIHPIDRKSIKRELNYAQLLGITKDKMRIYLTSKDESPQSIYEIARLRELTFRKVGEGTGKKFDLDRYDSYYSHLIVWDEKELDILGAYRIGQGDYIYNKYGKDGFYTSTLFDFSNNFSMNYLDNSIELGRSFIQKKYWNTNALYYLWQGIGAFLANNESVKFMFGGVSISNNYPEFARELIVFYYNKWFKDEYNLASSKRRFSIPDKRREDLESIFTATNSKDDYKILKNMLKPSGFAIPILYKHYSDLCEEKGIRFLDFGIDSDFANCIDGLILVDVELIKEEKKQRYIRGYYKEELKIPA